MKLRNILLLVLPVLFFASCQKDINDAGNIIPVVIADSNYLDKIFMVETGDTIETVVFTYDAQKRVVSMTSALPTGSYTLERKYLYTYNGNDSIPYKTNYLYADDDTRDTSVTYHFYDGSSKNLVDSVLSSHYTVPTGSYLQFNQVVHYSYNGGNKYAYTTMEYPLSPTNNTSRKDTATIDGINNITLNKGYFPAFPGPGYEQQTNAVLTYDSHINPFSLLSNFKAHQRFPSGETLYFEYFAYNNMLTQTETQWGSAPIIITNTYNYKTNGLPSAAHNIFNGTNIIDLHFTYKKL